MPITLERIPHDKQVAVKTLAFLGYPYRKIAKALSVSLPTIVFINKQVPSNSHEVEQFKKQLIGESYGLTARAWNRISDEKLDAMNALQLTTIGAIGIDKARDMEGSNRPVFNIINVAADIQKGIAELERKQAALLSLESAAPTGEGAA